MICWKKFHCLANDRVKCPSKKEDSVEWSYQKTVRNWLNRPNFSYSGRHHSARTHENIKVDFRLTRRSTCSGWDNFAGQADLRRAYWTTSCASNENIFPLSLSNISLIDHMTWFTLMLELRYCARICFFLNFLSKINNLYFSNYHINSAFCHAYFKIFLLKKGETLQRLKLDRKFWSTLYLIYSRVFVRNNKSSYYLCHPKLFKSFAVKGEVICNQ